MPLTEMQITKVYDFWSRLTPAQRMETKIATKKDFAHFFDVHDELIPVLERNIKRQNPAPMRDGSLEV